MMALRMHAAQRALLVTTILAAAPAAAQTTRDEAIEQLQRRMAEMQAEIDALKREREAGAATAAAKPEGTATVATKRDQVTFTSPDGRSQQIKFGGTPLIAISEKNEAGDDEVIFSFHPRGRLFVDLVAADGRELGAGATLGGIPLDPASDPYPSPEVEIATARLGFEGVMFRDVGYKFEVDFADNEVRVRDALVSYAFGGGPALGTIGNFKHSNSLYEQTSSRFITFVERPMFTDAFVLDRRVGADVRLIRDDLFLAAGVFGDAVNGDDADDGLLVNARAVVTPINNYGDKPPTSDVRLLHVGASAFYRKTGDEDAEYDFFDGGVLGPMPNLFGTRTFAGTSDIFVGGEVAFVRGPLALQAEYTVDFVNSNEALEGNGPEAFADDPSFHGGYVEVSYFLGDAAPGYKEGQFDRPLFGENVAVGDGGFGVFQVAGRLDFLDLNSGPVRGGRAISYGLGLNWWTTRYSRFVLDYFHVSVDDANDIAWVDGLPANNEVDGVALRAQVDF